MSACTRVRVSITGVVQGVGFRPTVARIAAAHRLTGFVLNDAGSVQCEFEGPSPQVDAAVDALRTAPPPLARIETFVVTARPLRDDGAFRILDSARRGNGGHRTLVPPDIATCPDCRRELFDPADRRHGHPFITCTNCGPRYTVITDLPYDRPATTMAGFPLCARCAVEYADPIDRRYHAQTISCHDCGPQLTWNGPVLGRSALESAAAALRAGMVVAIKGVGGYHLACRADDDAAVALLRRRKNRPAKPFAVMVADVDAARRICVVDAAAERALTSPAAPIVLLPARRGRVSADVAPGLGDLGVMLAYTPVHHLLLAGLDVPALVMTSANQGGSPIVHRDENLDWIDGLADAVLGHDRPIHVPCEDSVVGIADDGHEIPLRRSRGYAPLPVALDVPTGVILATGGDLKTTFALTDDRGRVHLSSHLGDMADPRTQDCFTAAVDHLMFLTATVPTVVAHDMHPRYATTGWARRHADRLEAVQHHHAHAVSLLAEHRRLDHPMIAIAYDGTGFGTDGTIWGGELLALTGTAGFTRVAHLAPFWLPGGEAAVRQPARIALDLLRRAGIHPTDDLPPVAALGPQGLHVLTQQFARGVACVPTTSMGRLFDAVASLLGVCQQVTYEGQAAVELEHLARGGRDRRVMRFDVAGGLLDPAPVVTAVVDGVRAGAAREDLARSFHDAVIDATVRAAVAAAADAGIPTVGLTGGVFANRLLLEGISAGLRARGLEVLTHRVVPCNDGGLALGQAAIAALRRSTHRERSELCASVSPAG
ncbi:carbamoyltransferase HypF [Mycobacterium sp. PSTR-4-N]|uniref:carbamoyltransferase HypF n=1 Tax=Mycobacterium sp. PSTR-4-N TaxID=2917745 RepID=UPI001F14BC68|nr:carbamoyltransferase HypF [Mycobacterium sp. PSTR-4-N]MCG7597191.1 carbamoyltransferase HypF [Mycobacterium sp. PSTR-4-N]